MTKIRKFQICLAALICCMDDVVSCPIESSKEQDTFRMQEMSEALSDLPVLEIVDDKGNITAWNNQLPDELLGADSEDKVDSDLQSQKKETEVEKVPSNKQALIEAERELREKIALAREATQKVIEVADEAIRALNSMSASSSSDEDLEGSAASGSGDNNASKVLVKSIVEDLLSLTEIPVDKLANIYVELIDPENEFMLNGALVSIDLMTLGHIEPHTKTEHPERIKKAKMIIENTPSFDKKLVLQKLQGRLTDKQKELEELDKTGQRGQSVTSTTRPTRSEIVQKKLDLKNSLKVIQAEIRQLSDAEYSKESELAETSACVSETNALAELYVSMLDPCTRRQKMHELAQKYDNKEAEFKATVATLDQLKSAADATLRDIRAEAREEDWKSILNMLTLRLEQNKQRLSSKDRGDDQRILRDSIGVLEAEIARINAMLYKDTVQKSTDPTEWLVGTSAFQAPSKNQAKKRKGKSRRH